MKTNWLKTILNLVAASSLLAALAVAQTPSYTVTDLGTLGGTYSYGYGINDAGWVSGGAATADQTGGVSQTAFLWFHGHMIDLGALPGGVNSEAGGPNGVGESAVLSETSRTDPNGEDFCEFGTHRQCLGAIWRNGVMTALPTLGGVNGAAFGINNSGEVVGFAENGVYDATCLTGGTPFQTIRFEAVKWDPNGAIHELAPLPGDTVAFGFGINDSGQVVGASGLCSNTAIPPFPSAPHAVRWDRDGSATDLGSLGNTGNSIASTINNRGEVAGSSLSPKDGTMHGFLWTKLTGMVDIGAFPGAVATVVPCCYTINNSSQVVGFAIDGTGNMRAIVWRHKAPVDLNTLIPPGSPWFLQTACSINDAGEIAGQGLIDGEIHAFLATPAKAGSASLAGAVHGVTSPAAGSQ
jgi:probable HAF family extracellular repeat protein